MILKRSLTTPRTPTALTNVKTQGGHENRAFIWRRFYSLTTAESMSLRLASFGVLETQGKAQR
jgi:hypothetical protein